MKAFCNFCHDELDIQQCPLEDEPVYCSQMCAEAAIIEDETGFDKLTDIELILIGDIEEIDIDDTDTDIDDSEKE